MNFGSLFSGFGGVDIGAMEAGLQPLWGIEYDADIAAVANTNLDNHVMVADILDVDPSTLPLVDVLHASPPCPNFSVAKTDRGETEHDIALAEKVAEFIDVMRPQIFTLENVYLYRKSESWAIIRDTLYECGYWMDLAHVNSADFGVPQTRQRMIVRAVRGAFVPYLPQPEPWVGWYEAIEDLVDTLPPSEFAPWQLERLPREQTTTLFAQGKYGENLVRSVHYAPSFTVTANSNQTGTRAFICNGDNASNPLTVSPDREPSWTIQSSIYKAPVRGWLDNGRVVAMTPRALARFQSFPDWYELPESKTLACRGIGNAVPPLLYQKIISQLVEHLP